MKSTKWMKAASLAKEEVAKKKPFDIFSAVKAVHAKQKLAMEPEERQFYEKVTKGPYGQELEALQENIAQELVKTYLDNDPATKPSGEDLEDILAGNKQVLKSLQEFTILQSLQTVTKDTKALAEYKRKVTALKDIVGESQRNYMVEGTHLQEKMKRFEEDHDAHAAAAAVEAVTLYDGLASLDEELQSVCWEVIHKRCKQKMRDPNMSRTLLENIQMLLAMGEAAFKKPEQKTGSKETVDPLKAMERGESLEEIQARRNKEKIEENAKRLKALEESRALHQAQRDSAHNAREKAKRDLETSERKMKEEIGNLEKSLATAAEDAMRELAELERQLAEFREFERKSIAQSRGTLTLLGNDLAQINSKEAELQKETDKLKRLLKEIQAEVAKNEETIVWQKERIKQLKAEIKAFRKRLTMFLENMNQGDGTPSKKKKKVKKVTKEERDPTDWDDEDEEEEEADAGEGQAADDEKKRFNSKEMAPIERKRGEKPVFQRPKSPDRRGGVDHLLKVLKAQLLLATPEGTTPRDWGTTIDATDRIAPTGVSQIAQVVELLRQMCDSGELDLTDFDDEGTLSFASSPPRRREHERRPKRELITDDMEDVMLVPRSPIDLVDSPNVSKTMGKSQSCVELGSRRSADRSSVRRRRRAAKAAGVPTYVLTSTCAPLGSKTACVCKHVGPYDFCVECQSCVPKLSVGWCLPPLAGDSSKSASSPI